MYLVIFTYSNPCGEASSSDLEHILDEIVVTSTSLDNFKQYDPLYSPIHICDKNYGNVQSDDNSSTIIRVNSMEAEELVSCASGIANIQSTQTLAPCTAYKNSKSRRMEYSMRGLKLGVSNPSQDSAFGSMTDGELSRASSFKLSSFQSVSSPIDEGVEDVTDHLDPGKCFKYIDSCSSSPCRDKSPGAHSYSSRDPSPIQAPISPVGGGGTMTFQNKSSTLLEPPKLVINDSPSNQATIYTASPIRKCATIEVFSQKYRVSSFEDMSYQNMRYQNKLGPNSSKKVFRSFDEQPRKSIISSSPSSSQLSTKQQQQPINRVIKSNSSSINYSTSVTNSPSISVLSRLISGKEKNILWKNSILSRKNNLIKSTESFFESSFDNQHPESEHLLNTSREDSGDETFSPRHTLAREKSLPLKRSPTQELRQSSLTPDLLPPLTLTTTSSSTATNTAPRKSRSESRHLFCLAKFKQNPILDSVALDYYLSEDERHNASIDEERVKDSSEHDNSSSSNSGTDDITRSEKHVSLSQTDIRKFIDADPGDIEEESTPLLEGMEMSPIISPTSSED